MVFPQYFLSVITFALLLIIFIGINSIARGLRELKRDRPEIDAYNRIYHGVEILGILIAVLMLLTIIWFGITFSIMGLT